MGAVRARPATPGMRPTVATTTSAQARACGGTSGGRRSSISSLGSGRVASPHRSRLTSFVGSSGGVPRSRGANGVCIFGATQYRLCRILTHHRRRGIRCNDMVLTRVTEGRLECEKTRQTWVLRVRLGNSPTHRLWKTCNYLQRRWLHHRAGVFGVLGKTPHARAEIRAVGTTRQEP